MPVKPPSARLATHIRARWLRLAVFGVATWFLERWHPLAHWLLPNGPAPGWIDATAFCACCIAGDIIWARLNGRPVLGPGARSGAVIDARCRKRIPLSVRIAALAILSVYLGWSAAMPERPRSALLFVGIVAYGFFVLTEVAYALYPGEMILPDFDDELMKFFSARMLHLGFRVAALLGLAITIMAVFAPHDAAIVSPGALALVVLTPGILYRRLDHATGP